MINWIPDINRYAAPEPPRWFLYMLWDFDSQLVIIPSKVKESYLLARRRMSMLVAPAMNVAYNDLLRRTRGGDGDMLATHNLVAIDYISGGLHGTWSSGIFAQLKARDTWAAGGADKLTDRIEEAEKGVEDKKRVNFFDRVNHDAGDAWRSYQARTGQRNQRTTSGSGKIARVTLK